MDATPSPEPLRWPAKQKLWHMEKWSRNVMADGRLTKAALRIAWSLVFSFHNEDARSWETKDTLAKRTGMSLSSVKNGLIDLERHGHIIRAFEIVGRKRMRVIRPCMNSAVLELPARERRGGRGSETQADADGWWPEVQTPGGTEVQTPCIRDSSFENPSTVGDVAEGSAMDPAKGIFGIEKCGCGDGASHRDRNTGRLLCEECAFDNFSNDPVPLRVEDR